MAMFKFPVKTFIFVAVTGGAGGIFDTCVDAVETKPLLTRQATGKMRTGTLKAMLKGHAKTVGIAATLIAGGPGACAAPNGAATGVTGDEGTASMSLASELRERIADLRAVGGLGGGGGGAVGAFHEIDTTKSKIGGPCKRHDDCDEGMTLLPDGKSPPAHKGNRVFCCLEGFGKGWCEYEKCYQRCDIQGSLNQNCNPVGTIGHPVDGIKSYYLSQRPGVRQEDYKFVYDTTPQELSPGVTVPGYFCCSTQTSRNLCDQTGSTRAARLKNSCPRYAPNPSHPGDPL